MEEFIERLGKHARHKEQLYDGLNSIRTVDYWLCCLAEETGEIASSIIRNRLSLAKEECIDVAHVAMLMYLTLDQKIKETA